MKSTWLMVSGSTSFQRPDALQHHGVAGGDVGAGAQHAHGDLSGDAVHVLPGGHAALLHGLLVPAHAQQVVGMVLFNPCPAALHDGLDGVHAEQGHVLLEHGVVEHVQMGVVEAGQHHGSLEILLLVPALGQGVRAGAQEDNLVVLRPHGLVPGHGPVHGHDLSVVPKSPHFHASFPPVGQICLIFISKQDAKVRQSSTKKPPEILRP